MVSAAEIQDKPHGKLTAKFVRDWGVKISGKGGGERKRWMRRSRLVAGEFATTKRLDTFSPATGAHLSDILPFKYLLMKKKVSDVKIKNKSRCCGFFFGCQ